MDTFWGPCDFFMKGVHRLLQQEPRLTRVRVTGKNKTKMSGNPDKREG
jgi:hypothetical protein